MKNSQNAFFDAKRLFNRIGVVEISYCFSTLETIYAISKGRSKDYFSIKKNLD